MSLRNVKHEGQPSGISLDKTSSNKLLHGYNYSITGLFMYGIPAKQLMKMYKQSSIFVAAVLTIVRNSSGPLL